MAERRSIHPAEVVQAACAPVLLAVYPIVYLFQHNQSDLPMDVLWRPLLISALTATALFAICWVIVRRPSRAGVLAFALVLGLCTYGVVRDVLTSSALSDGVLLGLWTALIAIAVIFLMRVEHPRNLALGLSVAAGVLVSLSVGRIVLYAVRNPAVSASDPRLWSASIGEPAPVGHQSLPDIYYIVPDDYERMDVLRDQLGYDNNLFIQELQNRGFVVAQHSRSPYSDSESNMASALNLDYLSRFGSVLGPTSDNAVIVTQVIADNRAARYLQSLGYRYIHIDSDNTSYPGDNPSISAIAAPDNLTYLWLRATFLRAFGGPFGFRNEATDARFRQSVLTAFDRLNAVADLPGPKFVFFHTLIPHDPYVFGPQGERVTFPDPTDERLGSREGLSFYVGQLRYMNQLLLDSVDHILARSTSRPIIVIQSDEGISASPEDFSKELVQDMRVKGLSALYMSGVDGSTLPQDLNSVNTFRYLFDQYFGTRLGMLPNASYTEGEHLYQPDEIHVDGDPIPQSP
jgi:hypothetical protein